MDARLGGALASDKETVLRGAVRTISGLEAYRQKEVGYRMKSPDSSVFGPISYAEFKNRNSEILSGKSNLEGAQLFQQIRTPSRIIDDIIAHELDEASVREIKAENENLLRMAIKFEEYASRTEEYVK